MSVPWDAPQLLAPLPAITGRKVREQYALGTCGAVAHRCRALDSLSKGCALTLQAFGRMFEPMMERWAKSYQAEVGGELRKYGLRVDDMLDPDSHPVRSSQALSAAI